MVVFWEDTGGRKGKMGGMDRWTERDGRERGETEDRAEDQPLCERESMKRTWQHYVAGQIVHPVM